MLNHLRSGVTALALGLAAPAALAAGDALEPKHHHWHHDGAFGGFEQAQLQRGYQVYKEVCSSCHSMKLLAYRHLGDKGAPFYMEEYPNPNDNPVVKAIAAEAIITDGPDEWGEMFERPGKTSDYFAAPFPNEQAARAANGGAYPPDLSVIVHARHHGADYIYSLLAGYKDPPEDVELQPGAYYNPYFPGGQLAMPQPLYDDFVSYEDGTEASVEQMAEDVTAFLAWAADPKLEARKQLGSAAIMYLAAFAFVLYISYKAIWRNVEH
ncbi:MAG: cytochrome c1 [Maricaulaceae bacterium]